MTNNQDTVTDKSLHLPEIFRLCCSRKSNYIAELGPFACEEYIYASDAHIIVRMPLPAAKRKPYIHPNSPDVAKLDWSRESYRDEPADLSNIVLAAPPPCPQCRGTGHQKDIVCPICEGTGREICDFCGSEFECTLCGGSGLKQEAGVCAFCYGTGKQFDWNQPISIGRGVYINEFYLYVLLDNGAEAYHRKDGNTYDTVYFRIEPDIEGLVLPTKAPRKQGDAP